MLPNGFLYYFVHSEFHFQRDCLNISRLPEWLFGFPRRHRRGVLTHLRQARCLRRNESDFHAHSKRIFKESKLD
uniref:Uncharacterized protein n=1 Tax=Anguilla anguilla TaxID=7936 RepID=A0A0E9WY08_ANGAN